MEEPTEKLLGSGTEASKMRILIREQYKEFADATIQYLKAAAKAQGIILNRNSFVIDDEEDFDPNILLNFDSALLHDIAPSDLDNLIQFLKENPEKISGITIMYSIAENEEQERCIKILKRMGVKSQKKGAELNMKTVARGVLMLES